MKMKIKSENLTSEEKFSLAVWYILEKIKKEILQQTDENNSITYTVFVYPTTKDPTTPHPTEEQILLRKLEKKGLFKEIREKSGFQYGKDDVGNPESAGIQFYLKVNKVVFNKYHSKYQKKIKTLKATSQNKNTLIFYKDGNVTYISPVGKIYKTEFGTKTNSYKLLLFLTQNPRRHFGFYELAKQLKTPKITANSPSDERRVRDTIQSIKEKLQYKGKDLFKTDCGFTLITNAQINN